MSRRLSKGILINKLLAVLAALALSLLVSACSEEQVSDVAEDVADAAEEMVDDAAHAADDAMDDAAEAVEEAVDDAVDAAEEAIDSD